MHNMLCVTDVYLRKICDISSSGFAFECESSECNCSSCFFTTPCPPVWNGTFTINIFCFSKAGLKPICEFMTFNFSMQAIDQVSACCAAFSSLSCLLCPSWLLGVCSVEDPSGDCVGDCANVFIIRPCHCCITNSLAAAVLKVSAEFSS